MIYIFKFSSPHKMVQAENPVLRTEEGRGRGLGVDAFGRDFSSNRSTAEIACARAKACFLLHKTNLVVKQKRIELNQIFSTQFKILFSRLKKYLIVFIVC